MAVLCSTGECVAAFLGVRCLTWPCWAELIALCFCGEVSVVKGENTVRGRDLKYHNFALLFESLDDG